MTTHAESKMSAFKQFWTRVACFIEAMEDQRAPIADYALSLGKRVEKLEHTVERLERQLHSREGRGIDPQTARSP